MRLALVLAASLLSGPAFAGSVDLVTSEPADAKNEGVMQITCTTCTILPKEKDHGYKVPDLAPGKQLVELKMINGEQKIVRTEAWLGGSPVVFISKATPEVIASYFPGKDMPGPDGIDQMSKTAALPDTAAPLNPQAPVEAAVGAAPVTLDTAGFELRKN